MAHAQIARLDDIDLTSNPAPKTATRPKWMSRIGVALGILPALMLIMSAAMKLTGNPEMMAMFVGKLGFTGSTIFVLGILELAITALYLIPPTAALGAVLVTGYLGGAIATHVRVGDPFLVPLAIGAIAWLGLYLRDARVRSLLPLRGTV